MALTAVHTAMHLEEPKNVHPFFSKPASTLNTTYTTVSS
jgi:hypothetical protein